MGGHIRAEGVICASGPEQVHLTAPRKKFPEESADCTLDVAHSYCLGQQYAGHQQGQAFVSTLTRLARFLVKDADTGESRDNANKIRLCAIPP